MLYKNITEITPAIIKVLIDKSSQEHLRIKNLYERYKQTKEGVPILTRTYKINDVEQKDKINNKLANDFVGEIIDMKVGFFCGIPISYTLDKTDYQQKKTTIIDKVKSVFTNKEPKKEIVLSPMYDEDLQVINDFIKVNSLADLDVETAKRASVCGYCGRLPYIDKVDGFPVEKVKLIEPWECIFIGETIEKPTWTIRYYDTITYKINGEEEKVSHAELYSSNYIEYYVKNPNGDYVLDSSMSTVSHFWGRSPLIGFANNDELMSDVGPSTLSLIDAYDKKLSDDNSESEQMRLAYMYVEGGSISDETIKQMQKTGAISLPEGCKAGFITKDINDTFGQNHLNRLENNIYKFSKTPNMNDVFFGGNLTGVAIMQKFRPFEDKCTKAELKFKKSFQSQFELLCKVWNAKGIAIDPMSIDYVFTRKYPNNKLEEAQFLRDSKGMISEETRFAHSSLVEDPQKEIEKLKAEETENIENFIARNEAMQKNNPEENNVDKSIPDDKTKQAISNEAKEEK